MMLVLPASKKTCEVRKNDTFFLKRSTAETIPSFKEMIGALLDPQLISC